MKRVKAKVPEPVAQEKSAVPELTFKAVDQKYDYKPINYGNGYQRTIFEFDREITGEEFLEYLKVNKYKLHEAKDWWDNHSTIEGAGTEWIYTWVLVYTD